MPMGVRYSKKQLILESGAKLKRQSLGRAELRIVQHDLRRWVAPGAPPSLGYIAKVLGQAGMQVNYEDRYTGPSIPERYASRLEGALRFDDLRAAEAALLILDAACRDYESESDRAGASLVRKLVLSGKQRAESLAANPRIRPEKRREKREIASWFRVWLESPSLFFDWFELRKQTEEFRGLLAALGESPPREIKEMAEASSEQ